MSFIPTKLFLGLLMMKSVFLLLSLWGTLGFSLDALVEDDQCQAQRGSGKSGCIIVCQRIA